MFEPALPTTELGWSGDVVRARLLGQHVSVVVQVDIEEHRRRTTRGVRSVERMGWIEEACESPPPTGVLPSSPPLVVVGVLRALDRLSWADLDELSLFAPLSARAALISSDCPPPSEVVWEAMTLDIGVVQQDGVVLAPAPSPTVRPSASRSLIAEELYRQWLVHPGDSSMNERRVEPGNFKILP